MVRASSAIVTRQVYRRNDDIPMSLLGVTIGNILGSLLHKVPQGVRSQDLGIGAKAEQGAYQPVVLRRRAAKAEQSSLLTKRLNSVAEVRITLHDQDSTRREPDTYFWVRKMLVGKLGMLGHAVFWGLGCAHSSEAVNAVGAFLLTFLRVGFTIPEASSRIETMREDGLLRGPPSRTIRDTEPLPRACTFNELFDKRRGIGAGRNIELNGLQELVCVLVMLRGKQNLYLGKKGLAYRQLERSEGVVWHQRITTVRARFVHNWDAHLTESLNVAKHCAPGYFKAASYLAGSAPASL